MLTALRMPAGTLAAANAREERLPFPLSGVGTHSASPSSFADLALSREHTGPAD